MNLESLIRLPFRYRPWKAQHRRLILADLRGEQGAVGSDREHLETLIAWLCRAQDQRDGYGDAGSVSAGWSFEDGWLPGYPETSGYIVETFLGAANVLGRPDLRRRAERILDWELSIQNPNGSFPGHFGEAGSEPVIFNTGQIIHGMLAGYLERGREDCLEAAVRAGYWMLSRQDTDGCWRRSVHNGIPHTYNTRAAWALLRAGELSGDAWLSRGALRNLEWALTQVTPSGWFRQNAFRDRESPFTHTIAYAARGFLEAGLLTGQERFLSAGTNAALRLAVVQRGDGWLAGAFDDGWRPAATYCCLTGVAQCTLIWQRLRQHGRGGQLQNNIDRALLFLKRNHHRSGHGGPTDGGIAGSVPIWGRYSRFEFPNWAAKFFSDALMMELPGVVVPRELPMRPATAREPAHG